MDHEQRAKLEARSYHQESHLAKITRQQLQVVLRLTLALHCHTMLSVYKNDKGHSKPRSSHPRNTRLCRIVLDNCMGNRTATSASLRGQSTPRTRPATRPHPTQHTSNLSDVRRPPQNVSIAKQTL